MSTEAVCPHLEATKSIPSTPKLSSINFWNMPAAIYNLMRHPLESFEKLHHRYGDLVLLPIPRKPSFFVFSPSLVQQILLKDASRFYKSENYDEFSPLLGKGLVTSDGDLWKQQRALVEDVFSLKQFKSFVPMIQEHTQSWVKTVTLEGSAPRLVGPEMMALTYSIIGQALFGKDLKGSIKTVGEMTPICADYLMKRMYIKIPKWLPLPGHSRFVKSLTQLNQVVLDLIQWEYKTDTPGSHFLGKLVQAKKSGHPMSDAQVRDEAMTLLLAGHETTAHTLSWALFCLSRNPHIVEKMREEINTLVGDSDIDFAAYKNLIYVRAVVQEAMRLYPPAYFMSRQPIEDYNLAGNLIKNGSVLLIPIWHLHRRRDIWPNSSEFNPDRFFQQSLSVIQKQAYIPFGAGPRRCIGSELSMTEAVIMLSYFVREFDLKPTDIAPIPHPSLTLRAENLWLGFVPRSKKV